MELKKILVVDDEPHIVKVIESRLVANKYKVITASNGEEGLLKAKEEKPDLILLDISMPGMDGFETLQKLKLNPKTRHIPVIVLTAEGRTQSLLKAEHLQATDYIIKPFKGEELIKYIRRYI